MGLFSAIKRQLLDVIEWEDETKNTIVYRYPLNDRSEIMNSSTLVVRPSQVALFVHKGQVADVFAPGTYTLATENIPFLTKFLSLPTGGNSRIKAEVYFINTKQFNNLRWGTQNPVIMRDPEFGNVRLRAFGMYSIKVNNPKLFMEELFGTNQVYTVENIADYLRSQLVQSVSDAIAESKMSILDLAANYKEFSKKIMNCTQDDFNSMGLKISNLVIENISLPEEVEKALDERTKLGVMDEKMGTFTRFQAANAIRDAAKNESGGNLAGLGVGLGAGTGVGQLFSDNLKMDNKEKKEAQCECEKCGARIKENAKFCPECGAKRGALVCPKCGTQVSKTAKFCPECGTSLKKTCKKCGADIKSGKFCPECGEKNN